MTPLSMGLPPTVVTRFSRARPKALPRANCDNCPVTVKIGVIYTHNAKGNSSLNHNRVMYVLFPSFGGVLLVYMSFICTVAIHVHSMCAFLAVLPRRSYGAKVHFTTEIALLF